MSSFVDDASRLDWVIDHSDTLYLSRDESGALISLLLTARGLLEVGGRAVPALYTGLCATREDRKNSGRVVSLLNYCMYEAREWQRREGLKLVIWGATASPSVYRIIQRVFANVQPRPDGDYSPASAEIAQGIRRHLGLDLPDGAHPFVLPGFAAGVRYTDSEARRIAAAARPRVSRCTKSYASGRQRETACSSSPMSPTFCGASRRALRYDMQGDAGARPTAAGSVRDTM